MFSKNTVHTHTKHTQVGNEIYSNAPLCVWSELCSTHTHCKWFRTGTQHCATVWVWEVVCVCGGGGVGGWLWCQGIMLFTQTQLSSITNSIPLLPVYPQ